jgi:hypothetical protein
MATPLTLTVRDDRARRLLNAALAALQVGLIDEERATAKAAADDPKYGPTLVDIRADLEEVRRMRTDINTKEN